MARGADRRTVTGDDAPALAVDGRAFLAVAEEAGHAGAAVADVPTAPTSSRSDSVRPWSRRQPAGARRRSSGSSSRPTGAAP
jgi:hypothetical protein